MYATYINLDNQIPTEGDRQHLRLKESHERTLIVAERYAQLPLPLQKLERL